MVNLCHPLQPLASGLCHTLRLFTLPCSHSVLETPRLLVRRRAQPRYDGVASVHLRLAVQPWVKPLLGHLTLQVGIANSQPVSASSGLVSTARLIRSCRVQLSSREHCIIQASNSVEQQLETWLLCQFPAVQVASHLLTVSSCAISRYAASFRPSDLACTVWLCNARMPSAQITALLCIDPQTYVLEAAGYSASSVTPASSQDSACIVVDLQLPHR
jgi:hypothetical protein